VSISSIFVHIPKATIRVGKSRKRKEKKRAENIDEPDEPLVVL
jgi:hypothetical protein